LEPAAGTTKRKQRLDPPVQHLPAASPCGKIHGKTVSGGKQRTTQCHGRGGEAIGMRSQCPISRRGWVRRRARQGMLACSHPRAKHGDGKFVLGEAEGSCNNNRKGVGVQRAVLTGGISWGRSEGTSVVIGSRIANNREAQAGKRQPRLAWWISALHKYEASRRVSGVSEMKWLLAWRSFHSCGISEGRMSCRRRWARCRHLQYSQPLHCI